MDRKPHERREFVSEWQRLKFQVANAEREIFNLTSKQKNGKSIKTNEDDEYRQMIREQQQYRRNVSQRMSRLRHRVKIFDDHFKKNKDQPDYVEKLRDHMTDVESCMNDFKNEERKKLESLLIEEQTVSDEMKIISSRLHNLLNTTTTTKNKRDRQVNKNLINNDTSNLPPEVEDFQKYVNEYGRSGGWDDFDHSTFLRLRDKCRGDQEKLIRMGQESLVGRSEADMRQHVKWYDEYMRLYNDKKAAIMTWRKSKEVERRREMEREREAGERVGEVDEEQKERERLEREKNKIEIEKWKQLKRDHASRIAEEKRAQEEKIKLAKEKQQQDLMNMRMEARSRLNMKKVQREEMKKLRQEQHDRERAAKSEEALRQIEMFRERDRQALEDRLEEKRRKEKEEELKKEIAMKKLKKNAELHVRYDRTRVYQPTDAWLLRHQTQDSDVSNKNNHVAQISRRAVPSWRKGL